MYVFVCVGGYVHACIVCFGEGAGGRGEGVIEKREEMMI